MDSADQWWLSLTDDRRAQIHRWITQRSGGDTVHTPGQQPLFDGPDGPDPSPAT